MKKIKLTCAHAVVKYLIAQKILINGKKEPLFPGVFGIFGHGNVACLGQALEENQKDLPTYRGHHEQNMALTGIGYARAMRRKQIFIATSSVGPGSTNMVTAAAVAFVVAAIVAPALGQLDQAFQFIQEYTGFISPGVFAIFFFGVFGKKTTSNAALVGAALSIPLSVVLKIAFPDHIESQINNYIKIPEEDCSWPELIIMHIS